LLRRRRDRHALLFLLVSRADNLHGTPDKLCHDLFKDAAVPFADKLPRDITRRADEKLPLRHALIGSP